MDILNNVDLPIVEYLKHRILVLSEKTWENKLSWKDVEVWLNNFDGSTGETKEKEQIHALYILSQFLYFGSKEIRVLLQALYRDLFLIPLIKEIREQNGGLKKKNEIKNKLKNELKKTRFLGIGNPSESGVHLLYYFRQENKLPITLFLDTSQILIRNKDGNKVLGNSKVLRYVFIDDVCGNGDTAIKYSKNVLTGVKVIYENIQFYYLSIFGTKKGLENVQKNSLFNQRCSAVFELEKIIKFYQKIHVILLHIQIISIQKLFIKLFYVMEYSYGKNIQEDIWMVNFYLAYIIIPQTTRYQSFGLTLRQVPQFLGILYLDGIQNKTIKR
jgi:hypothetical protein